MLAITAKTYFITLFGNNKVIKSKFYDVFELLLSYMNMAYTHDTE